MTDRAAAILLGVLAFCCVGLVLSALYPFSVSTPNAAAPADERFIVEDASSYRAAGSIVVGGETRLRFEGIVDTDGERYQRLVEDGVRSEQYQARPGGPVYERLVIEREAVADRMQARIERADNRVLLRENHSRGRVTLVVRTNGTNLSKEIAGSASVFTRNLQVAEYRERERESGAGTVYEPQNGWYSGAVEYRVTDASGVVRTGSGSRAVRAANVSWAVTEPAGSYAEYVLTQLTSDAPTSHRTTFRMTAGDTDVVRPPWVDESRAASSR